MRIVLESRWLGMGRMVAEFESRVADVAGTRHAVAVTSGTAALHLAVAALDLEPGDEVVVPSLTFLSCPLAIMATGAVPVFCEVEPTTANLDLTHVATLLTSRTRAVMPVHYAGFPCRLDELAALAAEHELRIVEDAAHAFGSSYRGRPIGSFGYLTCFSFDPVKNITCAEGGAIATDDDQVAEALRLRRNLGVGRDSWGRRSAEQPWLYEAVVPGMRHHMSDVNAAIGLAQLGRFDELRARKRALLHRYRAGLSEVPGIRCLEGDIADTFPFLCAARVADGRRDALLDALAEQGIQAWVHFVPNHLQPAFAAYSRPLPATEELFGELVSLPLHAELTDADVDRVVDAVGAFLEGTA